MITARLYRVILPVTDIDGAAEFYALVFDSPGERVSPGRHYFQCGDVVLACYSAPVDGDEPGDGWRFHENQYLYFAVPDLESIRERVVQGGGTLLSEIESMPWGETLFYATDPFGSRLSFVKSGTEFTGAV